jgi:hypothetical protein
MVRGVSLTLIATVSICQWCWAQNSAKEAVAEAPLTHEVVLSGLDNPTSVAIQPGTGTVFVANSAAGEVIRVVDGKAQQVITDFPISTYGEGPVYSIGPLAIAFIDQNTLVVGEGGNKDGEELLRIYSVPAPGTTIKADAMLHTLGPIEPKAGVSSTGEGNFYAIAVAKDAIYVTSNGEDEKGWILRAKFASNQPEGKLEPYIATKPAVGVDAPVAIALTPDGHILVGQMGEITQPKDSLLTFYGGESGKLLLKLESSLADISGLAYSSVTGRLYAVDFAWADAPAGGLFRLERHFAEGRQLCKAVELAKLDKPTALAFGIEGELYVTLFGAAKQGQLIKFAKGL